MFKSWLMTMMLVGVIASILVTVSEKVGASSVVKTAASLSLVAALILPLRDFNLPKLNFSYESDKTVLSENVTQTLQLEETERRLSAYVESYANTIDYSCDAKVLCDISSENELSVSEVYISSAERDGVKESEILEKYTSEFAIEASQIVFDGGF